MAVVRTTGTRRTELVVFLALVALAAAVRPAGAAGDDSPLVGRWAGGDEFLKTTIVFVPDGRYFVTLEVGETRTHEKGRYTVEGKKLNFRTQEGEAAGYDMALAGEKLTLTNPGVTMNLTLQPGSRKGVIEEVAEADEAKKKEDAEWAKRFPLKKAAPRPNLAVGELPKDPKPGRVFEGEPTTFGTHVSYVRFWSPMVTYQVVEGPDPGSGKAQTHWHFLPDGRFFHRNIKYEVPAAAAEGRALPGKVVVTENWGRYRVEKDDKGREVMSLESDAGEKLTHELIDGRRNLLFGDTLYGNTLWELYALQKAEGKKPELPPVPE